MQKSILSGKSILAVNDDPDLLTVLEEEVLEACPNCMFDKTTAFEEATQNLASHTYHLIILEMMGVRFLDLLDRAITRNIPVAMLTVYPFTPEDMRRFFEWKPMSCFSKEKLGEIVPFLEEFLAREYLPGWRRLIARVWRFLDTRSGRGKKAECVARAFELGKRSEVGGTLDYPYSNRRCNSVCMSRRPSVISRT